MPYCGYLGCGCCSGKCKQCGTWEYYSGLSEGLCASCRTNNKIDALMNQLDDEQSELFDGPLDREKIREQLSDIKNEL